METDVINIVSIDYDEDTDSLFVEVPLPNAKKDSIDLVVYRDWFALRALREDKEEADYLGEFALCCPVDQDNAHASYQDGILRVTFPLDEESSRPKSVKIN
jgi:HSP20 family molecular chaperone IbpA